ncbi:hypothetical protein PMZ80_005117 [Knufia obscura]|uniref:BTB domain-containing protein n=1 Tax=Knufia obscura TaxID=1635080 RepID=A0ABR0RPL4_9EURO|nr:hypothetical protein PMZ80_005117 [Knufia obscura]
MADTHPTPDDAFPSRDVEDASDVRDNQRREEQMEIESPKDLGEQMQLDNIEGTDPKQPELQPQESEAGVQNSGPSVGPAEQHILTREEPKMPVKPSSRPAKYTRRRIVTVLVGKEKEPYHIHMDLLRSQVPYFAASLKECWNNNKVPQETTLEDADPADFDAVVHWLYEKKLPAYKLGRTCEADEDDSGDESTTAFVSCGRLSSIYKLANFLMMHDLQNALIDADIYDSKTNHRCYALSGLSEIFDLELANTPLYQMALRSYCEDTIDRKAISEDFKSDVQDSNAEPQVLKDIFLLCEELRRTSWTPLFEEEDKCKYHIHPDGKKCAQE